MNLVIDKNLDGCKIEIFKMIENYGKRAKFAEQEKLCDLLDKVEGLTEADNSITLTDEEVLILQNGIDTFITSYLWKLRKELPEIMPMIKAIKAEDVKVKDAVDGEE